MGNSSDNGDFEEKDAIAKTKNILKKTKYRSTVLVVVAVVLVVLIVVSPFVASFVANKYTDRALTNLLDSLKGQCYVIYEKSDYDIWTRHLKVSNTSVICGEEEVVRFGLLDFAHIVKGTPLPSNLSVEFYDGVINMDTEVFGVYGKMASKLGYSAVPISGNFIYTLGSVSKNFKIEKMNIRAATIGDIAVELNVPNVTAVTALGALEQVFSNELSLLWISFYNDGFTNKIISRYAKTIESSDEVAKARIIHGIERRISYMYNDNAYMRDQLVQIYRFIEKPTFMVFKSDNDTKTSLNATLNSLDLRGWRGLLHSVEGFPLKLYAN